MRVSHGLKTVFASILVMFLAGTATPEETFFLLKSQSYVQHGDWDIRQGGPCQNTFSLPVNSHGEMTFKAWEKNCGNSVTLHYSFTPPPEVIRSGQKVRFEHSIQSSGKQGPDYYQGSGSIYGGCMHATSQLIENVLINGGGSHMQDNGPKSDHKSGSPVLFTGNGCNEGQQYQIAISMGLGGTHYYTYDVVKGTPPPITETQNPVAPPNPPVTTGQNDQTNLAGTTGQTLVQPDGTITDGKSIWLPEGRQRSATLTTSGSVQNGPTRPSVFRVPEPMLLVSIMTYHWNNGRGAAPGSIAVQHDTGVLLGPWSASGSDGQSGVPNAYWHVKPGVILQPGRYTVIDSNPETWATNSEVKGRGVFKAKLQKVVQIGSILPTPDAPSPPTAATPPKITILPPETKPGRPVIFPPVQNKPPASGTVSGTLPGHSVRPGANDSSESDSKAGSSPGSPPKQAGEATNGSTDKGLRWLGAKRKGSSVAAMVDQTAYHDAQGAWLVRAAEDNIAWQVVILAGAGPSSILTGGSDGYELIKGLTWSQDAAGGQSMKIDIRDMYGDGDTVVMDFTNPARVGARWSWPDGWVSHEVMQRSSCDLRFSSEPGSEPGGCSWVEVAGPIGEEAHLSGECAFGLKCYMLVPNELRF